MVTGVYTINVPSSETSVTIQAAVAKVISGGSFASCDRSHLAGSFDTGVVVGY